MKMSISNHPVEQEELMAYLDGEISPERAGETASHLEHCRECQQLAADLQEVSQMLLTWRVEESELELAEDAEDLDRALNNHGSDKALPHRQLGWSIWRPRYWPKPVWGLAGAAVIAAALFIPNRLRMSKYQSVMEGYSTSQPQGAPRPLATPSPRKSNKFGPEYGRNAAGKATNSASTASTLTYTADRNLSPDRYDSLNTLQGDESQPGEDQEETTSVLPANGPMIIRTAQLEVTTKDFDKARPGVEEILKRRHGYVGELNVNTPSGAARSLTGTLRVPASQLDATLADLKGLGRTEKELQGGEEVTQQYVDLQARLANAKHTEQRLTDILRERTGKLSDVLAVEMQISRVRGEIEQMEAQRKSMKNQVDFATLTVTLTEEYKEQLKAAPPSTGTQFRNAAVEGYRSLVDGIISFLLWLLSAGPTLLVWAAILFFPARMLWKKVRNRRSRA
jgi:hypothetical protein